MNPGTGQIASAEYLRDAAPEAVEQYSVPIDPAFLSAANRALLAVHGDHAEYQVPVRLGCPLQEVPHGASVSTGPALKRLVWGGAPSEPVQIDYWLLRELVDAADPQADCWRPEYGQPECDVNAFDLASTACPSCIARVLWNELNLGDEGNDDE